MFRDDDTYARIWTGARLPDGTDIETALHAANRTNAQLKAVKAVVYESDAYVGFSVEQLFKEHGQLAAQFDRALDALRSASIEFFEVLSTPAAETDTKENG